jgi:tRNA U55 pseudouridine synthase TruB
MLGSGAHLTDLVRNRNGSFSIEDAITLEDFEKICT